jgi:hypothetical protein
LGEDGHWVQEKGTEFAAYHNKVFHD